MILTLVTLLLYLLFVGVVVWLALYVIAALPLPPPFGQVARVVVVVVGTLIMLLLLWDVVAGLGLGVPRPLPRP